MKKYLAFWGHEYYPSQGMRDFVGDFEYESDAVEAVEAEEKEESRDLPRKWQYSWGLVWDSTKRENVWLDGIKVGKE